MADYFVDISFRIPTIQKCMNSHGGCDNPGPGKGHKSNITTDHRHGPRPEGPKPKFCDWALVSHYLGAGVDFC